MNEVNSYPERATPAMDGQEKQLATRIGVHVRKLAEEIGERNVFRPEALHAAADYLRGQWAALGYMVQSQGYVTHGVARENLEVTLRGLTRPEERLLVGAHYDSVQDSPGANDNASGVAALLADLVSR